MAYGMNQLRKAGRALSNFDEAYADKISAMYMPTDASKVHERGPIGAAASVLGATLLGGHPARKAQMILTPPHSEMKGFQIASEVLGHGIPAISTTVRYGAPIAGVALAGKGLMDLTDMFNQQSDQTSGTIMP